MKFIVNNGLSHLHDITKKGGGASGNEQLYGIEELNKDLLPPCQLVV
jgi:hypothetical protein